MSGPSAYDSRSPTQQARYPYSPSTRDLPPSYAAGDNYQHPPPHSPPSFPPPSSLARSPQYGRPNSPPMNTTLPPLNGSAINTDIPSFHGPSVSSAPAYTFPRPFNGPMMAPAAASPSQQLFSPHTHPSATQDGLTRSPRREPDGAFDVGRNSGHYAQPPIIRERPPSPQEKKPVRTDPMSFASILSGPAEEEAPRKPASSVQTYKPIEPAPIVPPPKIDLAGPDTSKRTLANHYDPTQNHRSVDHISPNGVAPVKTTSMLPPSKPRKAFSERDQETVAKALERLEAMDNSLDMQGFEQEWQRYLLKGKKRTRDVENIESKKRKKRRTDFLGQLARIFEKQASQGVDRFNRLHEASVIQEVQQKEVQDEKERKKDMQRKRRRENTVRTEMEKLNAAQKKVGKVDDEAERERLNREIERSRRKIKETKRALERSGASHELNDVGPLSPNLEGGTTSSFHIYDKSPPPAAPKGKGGRKPGSSSTRPKKSKEKKQAEKDAAEAAYAAMEKEEAQSLTPKEDRRKETLKKEGKAARSKETTPALPTSSLDSKGYNQLYEQIWRDIARKDIPKVYRIKAVSLSTRKDNHRKTAQLASKQARKWQERTNKSVKDTQARAKRTMREMMSFWKRNEREERDLRRLAEKQELEMAKKAEAEREANRQRRKLNFLLSQTELYSHFIGHKIKTAEAEGAPPAAGVGEVPPAPQPGDLSGKTKKFEELDFDAEDETALREAAMANAQNAVQQAQERARSFNKEGKDQLAALDEGEMNFQNPTSLGDIEIPQPKMLNCQLKEYQLKGLNWLVNLYEQGINGILADEMGLGKTVQSISVMAYLAEVHNIWGPFLVIAPASTLHNWQQEITKFVPEFKVLPYWGSAKDRKVLRKFWDRKHITYTRESGFHVLVTSYQLVVLDAQYFQKVKWQYMILDEAQAIKSSQSSRWKNLLGFHCRNRLLLTGTPIQNNMQELWALLHFIMPTLFDSHDEFSEWFSKDIESHAQSNTKLDETQLKRLHMILKPFMLRRVKKHVQKELGDKVEKDVFCDLTYRQRSYYMNLRNRVRQIDFVKLSERGDDADRTTLMNLVMQFRKVCNHPDLFERAVTMSPLSLGYFAETASFVREGSFVNFAYSTRNLIEYSLPRLLCNPEGRLDVAGPGNDKAGFKGKYLYHLMNIWTPENIKSSVEDDGVFSWLRFVDTSPGEAYNQSHFGVFERAVQRRGCTNRLGRLEIVYDEDDENPDSMLPHSLFNIVDRQDKNELASITQDGYLHSLLNVTKTALDTCYRQLEPLIRPAASAPPITIHCSGQAMVAEVQDTLFNIPARHALYGRPSRAMEQEIIEKKLDPTPYLQEPMLPAPDSLKGRFNKITVPSMSRFVTDSGKLAKLDELLRELKAGGHRVLLYFQMTRMIDLMEEYLTYRNYKYCRLDGSTKLEDRRDTVADFQQRPEIFIFLLSTRAGGLGINLTAADTVIFYDSDWNPTIDSQAMDRAHRLGQTKQVTVYRLITRGSIEERIRMRALQKEEVQRVVIQGGAPGGVDFNTRNREIRTKDIAMWLADDDQVAVLEQKEKEALEKGEEFGVKKTGKKGPGKRKREMTLDDMYHEGEGHFDDSAKPSGAATPIGELDMPTDTGIKPRRGRGGRGPSKKAKTTRERLRLVDGGMD
ncbi:hypothetical protein VTO42DRAFT_5653 [Malbranchea cinnamomea]